MSKPLHPTSVEIMRELADIRALCIDFYYEQDDLNHPTSKKFLKIGDRVNKLNDSIAFNTPIGEGLSPTDTPPSDDPRDNPGRIAH